MSTQESNYIYKTYFQKSLNFLFTLLGYSKMETFVPKNTYLWWEEGEENIETLDILVHYHPEDETLFEIFEKKELMTHPHFDSCYSIEGGGKLYVFNLAHHVDTVEKFLRGRYSQFTDQVKKRILNYHGASLDKVPRPGRTFHTSLYPELYMEQVAKEIKVDIEELKEIGELCSIYDKKRETFSGKFLEKCEIVVQKQVSLKK
jgi:hypothetical protein